MSLATHDDALEALKDSLAAYLPARTVERNLAEPANVQRDVLLAGLVCVVADGGGGFANYRGREGQLGTMKVHLVCFVQVEEGTAGVEIERAELALLGDLLNWVANAAVPGLDVMYPVSWTNSKQLEHPFGWLVLELQVKT